MNKQNKKGFSLLELVLVLGVGSMMAFMRFQDMKNEQETIMAKAVGQQMKQIGEAVNGYINIRYDKLSTLTSSSSQSSDPGPRACNASGCEITYQTLVNEGLLPASYTGINAQKSSYKIILKRSGISPNYVVNGLITTTLPWMEGDKYRYDLLGRAMQAAGIDSGMTQSATLASGLQGAWKETSTDYSNITSAGLMAYRVGYDSAMYSVYLRRDGTLPMTGDLNLDGHNINNVAALNATGNITTTGDLQARNIKATGKIDADGNISAGNWVWAKNGYGDAIGFGGDGYSGGLGRDYEIKMLSNHPLTIHSPTSSRGNDVILDIDGNMRVQTDISSLRNITASGNIEAAQNVKGSTLESTGRATVGEFVQINGSATIGDVCSPNGLQGRVQSGVPIYCIDGKWQSQGSLIRLVHVYKEKQDSVVAACNKNEIVIGGGGNSYDGVGFIDQQGVKAAPGLDGTQPTGDLKGWWVSGVHANINAENLNAYAICMRIW
ncbi:shufflon system plasmid conjugative transfer pilus tip adhesin PilV [Yersinia enterocolitica]|uniref:shufflon system plasmid conjugative transfer pilus tip adhesin PilV n=1 Tax=Hafnia alvei TaxID=569 RepID=UPI003B7F3FD8